MSANVHLIIHKLIKYVRLAVLIVLDVLAVFLIIVHPAILIFGLILMLIHATQNAHQDNTKALQMEFVHFVIKIRLIFVRLVLQR